jgi:magnesium-transporting ATPase (P-type)
MLKAIIAVIVSFVVMAIFSFAAFTCAYFALGAERVFEAESYDVSTIWIVVMVVLSLIGGVIGGFICAAISKSMGVCKVFAGIVLALGLISGVVTTMKERPDTARSGDVPNFQAMQMAQTPMWLCLLNPVLGAVGVLFGARKKLPAA